VGFGLVAAGFFVSAALAWVFGFSTSILVFFPSPVFAVLAVSCLGVVFFVGDVAFFASVAFFSASFAGLVTPAVFVPVAVLAAAPLVVAFVGVVFAGLFTFEAAVLGVAILAVPVGLAVLVFSTSVFLADSGFSVRLFFSEVAVFLESFDLVSDRLLDNRAARF